MLGLDSNPIETIAFVFIILSFTTILSTRLKVSPVLFEIIIGMIIGPHILQIIAITDELKFLKDMGLIVLLFLAGLDFDFNNFKSKIKNAILIAIPPGIVGFGLIFILIPFGWFSRVELLTLALILTTTSISLSVSVLKEKISSQNNYDTVVLAIIISNVLMILVAGVMINNIVADTINYTTIIVNFLIVLIFISLILFLSQNIKLSWHKNIDVTNEQMEYIQTKFAFGLLGLVLLISYFLHIELAVVSFFAGVYVKETTDLEKSNLTKFNVIGYGFLVPIFFLVMGMQINPSHFLLHKIFFRISIILILSFVFQVLLTSFSSYLANYSIKESIIIGIGLSACSLSGGFAVLEIANREGLIGPETYSIFSALITLSVFMTVIGLELVSKVDFGSFKVDTSSPINQ